MNILHTGKMTSKELAAWFGLTYNSYKNQIPKRLKMLEDYCAFEKVFGGVMISEVYIETFAGLTNDDELFMKEIEDNYKKNKELVYSVAGMARKFIQTYSEVYSINGKLMHVKSIERRLNKARARCLPLISQKYPDIMGAYGNSKRIWSIKLSELNEYRLLTRVEETIFNDLIIKYYSSEKGIEEIKENELSKQAFRNGEITADELGEELKVDKGKNFFFQVLCEFTESTGKTIVSASEAQIKKSYKYFEENGIQIDKDTGAVFKDGDKMEEVE